MDGGHWKGKLSDYGSTNFLHTVTPDSYVNQYAAPEAASRNLHSPKMNVYSFDILLVEMTACVLPNQVTVIIKKSVEWPSSKK